MWSNGLRGFSPRRYPHLDDLMPYGSIRAKYDSMGGPNGPLGRPTRGERDSMLDPVLYLLHGGKEDFISWDRKRIREMTAGKPIIVVMPDGGQAGWYSNAVSSNVGARNWEHFHIEQLVRWTTRISGPTPSTTAARSRASRWAASAR